MRHANIVLVLILGSVLAMDPAIEEEEERAVVFLQHVNYARAKNAEKNVIASWNYDTNLTEANQKEMIKINSLVATENTKIWEEVTKFNWKQFRSPDIKRQFKLLSLLGPEALPEEKFKKYSKIQSEMIETYSTAKICQFENKEVCNQSLEPDLTQTLSTSNDTDELKHIWLEWRNAIGPKVRPLYKDFVDLQNEAARLNDLPDTSAYWLTDYDTPDIKAQIELLWRQLEPLYFQIHAYVRHQLRKKYGDIVTEKGPIPMHLLGNMWAQQWEHIYEDTKPYPKKEAESVTDEMVKQEYDYLKIFKTAEDFFVSINLTAMPESFWNKSMLHKPSDREVVCHAAAYDFYNGEDFRIRQCTAITEDHLITAHHEMGHVEYFLQYKDRPAVYRSGANEGFHEAIGDVIALSVKTRKHLKKLGLINSEDDAQIDLNNLYNIGLSKIVFLPFAYVMDLWRWGVFSGNITSEEYNCKWWKLVEKYQGLEPPVDRTEEDFDPASKFHIVANVPYIRYFVSFVIQFQFHRSLCLKADDYIPHDPSRPLYKCDIYKSTEAGNALKQMLQLGGSRPWQDAMEVLTGQRDMDAGGILEYFRPLQKWLEIENERNQVYIGWEPSKRVCAKTTEELPDA